MLRVAALFSQRKNAKSRSYADNLSRECKHNACSFDFSTVEMIVIDLISTFLNDVCSICFKRNKSLHSIEAGKPAPHQSIKNKYIFTKNLFKKKRKYLVKRNKNRFDRLCTTHILSFLT